MHIDADSSAYLEDAASGGLRLRRVMPSEYRKRASLQVMW